MCQCGFIDYKKCTALVGDVDKGGKLYMCRGRG